MLLCNQYKAWDQLFVHLHCGIWFVSYRPLYIALSIREPDLFYKCPHGTWSNFKLQSSLVQHILNLNFLPNLTVCLLFSSDLYNINVKGFSSFVCKYLSWISIIEDFNLQGRGQDRWITGYFHNK